jgi:hypothetical protein
VNKYALKAKFIISFTKFLLICYYMALLAGLPVSTLVDKKGFSLVDIILPWFSMLIYHLGNQQYACWCLQFIDVVLIPST